MKIIYDNIKNYNDNDYRYFFQQIKKEKQKRILKILRADDKKRAILGEVLLMKLLTEVNLDYNSLPIYVNQYGKPYFRNFNLYFNISHSHDYVVCVISKRPIGIDIEKVRYINSNIAKQFSTSRELEYISATKKHFFTRCFEIFTLKEAYFKCLGTNLNNIKNIEFNIHDFSIQCSDKRITSQFIYIIDNYIVAVCEMNNIF